MSKKKRKQHNDKEQQMKVAMIQGYYKKHLSIMIERELDVRLTWWAKWLLKLVQKGIRNVK